MKKFMMYVVVLISFLFVGYTTYYFCRNNETISLTLAESESVYLNVGKTYDLPIAWDKPYGSTNVYDNVSISNTSVLSFNKETKKFLGLSGGVVTVSITPSNKEFGPFVFDVHVGDGTVLNPYYISSAEEISEIGQTEGELWQLYHSYQLICDINLSLFNEGVWTPVGAEATPFCGTFSGNGYQISNLNITTDISCAGLFGVVSKDAVIEDIYFNKVTLQGNFDYAGAVAGINYGKVGKIKATNVQIKNEKSDSFNGGLVGATLCSTTSEGAFVSRSSIELCSVNYTMASAGVCGGITGKSETSIIFNCKAVATAFTYKENTTQAGGLVGLVSVFATSDSEQFVYRFNIIKNNLIVASTLANQEGISIGIVAGSVLSTACEYENRFIGNYYQSASTLINPIGYEDVDIDDNLFFGKSYALLQNKSTYVNWNFTEVWQIEEDMSIAEINFETGDYVAHNEIGVGDPINSLDALITVLNTIREFPYIERVYTITEDLEYDLQDAEWQTIAPNIDRPLRASIVCAEGKTLTIKNFKLSGNNSSFFGYISGTNTLISNINFENVDNSSTSEYIGIVATILSDATIQNVKVDNANISTNKSNVYAGMIVGGNKGYIKNAKVNETFADEVNVIEVKSTPTIEDYSINFGGIAGISYSGEISNVTVSLVNFVVPSDKVKAYSIIGGIVGNISFITTIQNAYNYDAFINQSYIGTMRIGGVVGYVASCSAIIDSCFSKGLINLESANSNIIAGGLTSYLGASARLTRSFYSQNSLTAYNLGGLAYTNDGIIDQCYVDAEMFGANVGGLTYTNNKEITNCIVSGSIKGFNNASVISGLASHVSLGSNVEHCFSNVSFVNPGKAYAESEDEFRAKVEKVFQIFDKFPNVGAIQNCIVINYGTAEIKTGFFGWVVNYPFIECSDAQAKGVTGDYSVFKNDAGFDQTAWTFEKGEEGAYPTLSNVVVDPATISVD